MALYDALDAEDAENDPALRMERLARAAFEPDARAPYSPTKCVRCRKVKRDGPLLCAACQDVCNAAWDELHAPATEPEAEPKRMPSVHPTRPAKKSEAA